MVKLSYEKPRGCGRRKPGGLYLVAPGDGEPCCKLPFLLTVCPTCHAGIKPARGWTWVDADALLATAGPCTQKDQHFRNPCPASRPLGQVGLLWVGEKFYPTPDAFDAEALDMGISRRISALPKGFKLGETWVLLAHRKAVPSFLAEPDAPLYSPGIFRIFKPQAIEYVVKGDETPEELEKLQERGITPVRVVPIEDRTMAA